MSVPADQVDQLVVDHLAIVRDVVDGVRARLPRAAAAALLEQAGHSALTEAARAFVPRATTTFATFAIPRVRSAVHEAASAPDPAAVDASSALVDSAVADLLRRPGLTTKRTAAAARLDLLPPRLRTVVEASFLDGRARGGWRPSCGSPNGNSRRCAGRASTT